MDESAVTTFFHCKFKLSVAFSKKSAELNYFLKKIVSTTTVKSNQYEFTLV